MHKVIVFTSVGDVPLMYTFSYNSYQVINGQYRFEGVTNLALISRHYSTPTDKVIELHFSVALTTVNFLTNQ